MSKTPELVYFNGRGRAEIIRLVLSACSLEFEETHLKMREQYLALKPELEFGQLPLLRIDEKNLVQTGAIVRYLARSYLLYGKDEDEKTKVDMYYDGSRDFYAAFLGVGFYFPLDKVVENTKGTVTKFLPFFNKILKSNGSTGYLVGNSLTLADLGLLETLLAIKDYYEPEIFDDYPEIKKFMDEVCQLQFCQKYVTDIRKPTNSSEYISCIKEVFAM